MFVSGELFLKFTAFGFLFSPPYFTVVCSIQQLYLQYNYNNISHEKDAYVRYYISICLKAIDISHIQSMQNGIIQI